MKKTTWLLLAISVVAMLLVAGCTPTTPAPTASPTPTPTATPTTPPADKECPKVVSTTVTEGYWSFYPPYVGDYFVKLTVTFDEPIASGCIENPYKWNITVKNSGRKITEIKDLIPFSVDLSADGKKADVYFDVWEPLSYVVKDVVYKIGDVSDVEEGVFTVDENFVGLICSEDEAKDYATPSNEAIIEQVLRIEQVCGCSEDEAKDYATPSNEAIIEQVLGLDPDDVKILSYTLVSGPGTPKYADNVEWKLKDCIVADELGNACCDYSGKACCLEPICEPCEETGCPLGSGVPCD